MLPKQWIVERAFAWLGKYRRLSEDYETLPHSSDAMIVIAMINLMVHRLSPRLNAFSHTFLKSIYAGSDW